MAENSSEKTHESPEEQFMRIVAEDSTLFGLVTHEKLVAHRISLLEEHPHRGKVPTLLLAQAGRRHRAVDRRPTELRDMWAEAKADPETYKFVQPMRDWQRIAERQTDPLLRQEALERYQDAREEYESHVYGEQEPPPGTDQ